MLPFARYLQSNCTRLRPRLTGQGQIQMVIETESADFLSEGNSHNITPLLRDRPYWLRVTQRNDLKRWLMAFKALHGLAPGCISDYSVKASTNHRRSSLRSAWLNCLVVPPPSKTIKFEERSFGICGHNTWNSLSDCKRRWLHRRVKSRLNTYLFELSYG